MLNMAKYGPNMAKFPEKWLNFRSIESDLEVDAVEIVILVDIILTPVVPAPAWPKSSKFQLKLSNLSCNFSSSQLTIADRREADGAVPFEDDVEPFHFPVHTVLLALLE